MKKIKPVLPLLIIYGFTINLFAESTMDQNGEKIIFDFKTKDQAKAWNIVNDGVMGGLSSSGLKQSSNETAVFSGKVSLENNGGFASVRAYLQNIELANHSGIIIRVKGDGKDYNFRIRTDSRFDGVSYSLKFKTEKQKWINVKLPFSDFEPTFRGRILRDVKKIDPEEIRQIGILISDYQAGNFQLEIDWIKAY